MHKFTIRASAAGWMRVVAVALLVTSSVAGVGVAGSGVADAAGATTAVGVGTNPFGVAVNPTGTRVYVTNSVSNTVSVIDTSTDTVTAISMSARHQQV